jgi:hypothetical protein
MKDLYFSYRRTKIEIRRPVTRKNELDRAE